MALPIRKPLATDDPQSIAESLHPFGEPDCESELRALGERYSEYYFASRFSRAALDPEVYLIIGRRGTGKTALSHFFEFQKTIKNSCAIDVDEPAVFEEVSDKIKASIDKSREFAIPKIAKLWEFVIWSVIFNHMAETDARIQAAALVGKRGGRLSAFIHHLLDAVVQRFLKSETNLLEELEALLAQPMFEQGRKAVLEAAAREPIIVAIDTLESYDIGNEATMRTLGALIQCASDFNRAFARQGVHLKVFCMGEIFPFVKEEVVLNTLKFVRNELHLHWRPKDLMRLISWRFAWYLDATHQPRPTIRPVNWDDHASVLENLWAPVFGRTIVNGRKREERSYPYVLRHTQLRPRQLIVLCNAVAKRARPEGTFPKFTNEQVVAALREGECALADEIVNSYSATYKNVGKIVDCLTGLPVVFKGNELDKRAKMSAAFWPAGTYSPDAFRQLLTQLGVVGRVRAKSDAGYIEADFEYFEEGRLPIMSHDDCVLHPMFYKRLRANLEANLLVYPFPDHPEFAELMARG
jgi:hypothetical protein